MTGKNKKGLFEHFESICNLFRENKGQIHLVGHFRRDLVGIVVSIVSDLTKQLDRLLAKLGYFSDPAAQCISPLVGVVVLGLREIR